MAKKSNGKMAMAARSSKPRKAGRGGKTPGALDEQARIYANLLKDPCQGSLCHPTYSGTDNGILTRFETDTILFAGATDTAGVIHWIPGGIGTTGTLANHLIVGSAATAQASITPGVLANAAVPGVAFLVANAASARCVAACVQIYWAGSESNRQGIVYSGITNGATVVTGVATTADAVSQVTQYVDRMPTNLIEVRWRPADGDQLMIPPTTNTVLSEFARKNAITFSFKGLPVSTGVRVRLVAVYEWTPSVGDGIVNPVLSRNVSGYTINDVVSYLDRNYPDWVRSLGMGAANFVASVAYGTRRRAAIRL